MMKRIFLKYKSKIKYRDVEFKTEKWTPEGMQPVKHIYTVTGIGQKAIKFQLDHGEDEFVFYDSHEFQRIAKIIIKSFQNPLWNKEIRRCIKAQKKYCEDHQAPHFAPEDGFCWSCGNQIYAPANGYEGRDIDYASKELITGCPHCHKSYCD